MSDAPSFDEIRSLFNDAEIVYPAITPEAAKLIGKAKLVIESVGLPKEYADWYEAVDPIIVEPVVRRFRYDYGDGERSGGVSVRIGKNNLGFIVFEPETGDVVYVEADGTTMLINTSLERFLYFLGRFMRSFSVNNKDLAQLKRDCLRVDPIPLADPEAVWSVTIEEIEDEMWG
jgi:hypothetical protein